MMAMLRAGILILFSLLMAPGSDAQQAEAERPEPTQADPKQGGTGFEAAQKAMLQAVEVEFAHASELTGITAADPRVMAAMKRVPRHLFVPEALRRFAYLPRPLPVWKGQNTASPCLIARMSQLAEIEPGDRVFETGTGAGYHAAILAELGARVHSLEIIEPLARESAATLDRLGYADRVTVEAGDGYYGWPESGPFDAIIVKESIDHVPTPLLNQLKPGGRLVIPLGAPQGPQFLTVIEVNAEARMIQRQVLPVLFSPLQGGERT